MFFFFFTKQWDTVILNCLYVKINLPYSILSYYVLISILNFFVSVVCVRIVSYRILSYRIVSYCIVSYCYVSLPRMNLFRKPVKRLPMMPNNWN